jgi:hypothetical protein
MYRFAKTVMSTLSMHEYHHKYVRSTETIQKSLCLKGYLVKDCAANICLDELKDTVILE